MLIICILTIFKAFFDVCDLIFKHIYIRGVPF